MEHPATKHTLISLTAAAVLAAPAPGAAQGAPGAPDDEVTIDLGPTTGLVVDAPAAQTRLELHLATWFRFETDVAPGADTTPTFRVPLTRFQARARFFDGRLQAFVQPELSGGAVHLLDAFLEAELVPPLRVRAGQFRTPFSRAYVSPVLALQLPDRGLVDAAYRLGRDTGLMALGQPFDGAFEYFVGIFNGAPINTLANDRPAPLVIARFVYDLGAPVPYDQVPAARGPVEPGLAIGVDGAYLRHTVTVDPGLGLEATEESWRGSVDVAAMAGPVAAVAEGFLRYARLTNGGEWVPAWGAYVQGGVFVLPRLLEVAARLGWADPDADAANDLLQTYELALNLYALIRDQALGHHLKGSLRYAVDHSDAPFGPALEAGVRHRVTLQVQWWM